MGWGNAGYKSLADKLSSCGGQINIVEYSLSNTLMVVNRKGRRFRRIVNSSTAAEALSLSETIVEAKFVRRC